MSEEKSKILTEINELKRQCKTIAEGIKLGWGTITETVADAMHAELLLNQHLIREKLDKLKSMMCIK